MVASYISDRLLWGCLGMFWICLLRLGEYSLIDSGVTLFLAVRTIVTDLRSVNELTEIKHDANDDKIISEGTEDGMQVAYSI